MRIVFLPLPTGKTGLAGMMPWAEQGRDGCAPGQKRPLRQRTPSHHYGHVLTSRSLASPAASYPPCPAPACRL